LQTHILLENCKQTISGREREEENLPVPVLRKAAVFSLQRGPAAQPGPGFEVTQILWCCCSTHRTKLLRVLQKNKMLHTIV